MRKKVKIKKEPLRTCMGCNQSKEKNELIRIVKSKEGSIEVDLTGKKNGRGAYICRDENCLNKLMKSKRLSKLFEQEIDQEIYESLRGVIIDQ